MTPGAPERPRKDPDTGQIKYIGNWIGALAVKLLPGLIVSGLLWFVSIEVRLTQNGYQAHRDRLVAEEFSKLPPQDTRDEIKEMKHQLQDNAAAIATVQIELEGFRRETSAELRGLQRSIERLLED